MWGAGQASSRGRMAQAPRLLTEASGYRPRCSGATTGLLAKCTSVVHLGSGQVELPHCPSAFGARPGLVWGQPCRCKLPPDKDLSPGSQGMVTAPDFIGRISSVAAHLLPGLTRGHLRAALPLSGGQCYTDPDRGLGRAWGPQHARVAPPDHGGSPCPPGPTSDPADPLHGAEQKAGSSSASEPLCDPRQRLPSLIPCPHLWDEHVPPVVDRTDMAQTWVCCQGWCPPGE